MSSLISLQPIINHFDVYLDDINSGIVQIPEFQRDFIWDLENVLKLLESIEKNYPIGSFLFWKPETQFKVAKQIGPYFIKDEMIDAFEEMKSKYVLDGYQRMSSLFGALMNPKNIHNFSKKDDLYNSTFNIYYNLKDKEFQIYKGKEKERYSYIIPAYILLDYEGFLSTSEIIQKDFDIDESKIYTSRLKKIVTIFERYKMPVIEIAGGTLEEAIDIFTLLNKEGKPITPDWILSAKTYSSDFRLGDKIDEIVEKLENYNFTDKKPKEIAVRELIFRSIQSSFGDLYLDNKKTNILILSKQPNFKEQVEKTILSIEKVVNFLFEELLIVDNKLVPASMQFIFLVEFFNYNSEPTVNQIQELKKWFWITSFVNYFSIYTPSKRITAFKTFQSFSKGLSDDSLYKDSQNTTFSVPELANKVNLGNIRSKSRILFMLNYSNGFNRIDADFVENYRILRLFSDIDKGNSYEYGESANMVVCLYKMEGNIFNLEGKKVKDMSFLLLQKNKGKFSEFFITDEMRDEFEEGNINKVLQLRSNLILETERKFYINIGLTDDKL